MNRRQRKKAYKKKHGYNPPKTEIQYHYRYWGKSIKRWWKEAVEAIKQFHKIMCTVVEQVKTMPEEEFEERFLYNPELDYKEKKLAWKIRNS